MGTPGSIGCIRMKNSDIIELFDLVPAYTPVDIVEFAVEEGSWDDLMAAARPLREAVFVHEQGVPVELEWDEYDATSRHVVARDTTGTPIGTGRLLADGRVGRMAVLSEWRGRGVGRALLERLMEAASERGMTDLALHAQAHAAGFYEKFGFLPEGGEFPEAGIPHWRMRRALA
jgi:predicted GNAT family N-acyltransferase